MRWRGAAPRPGRAASGCSAERRPLARASAVGGEQVGGGEDRVARAVNIATHPVGAPGRGLELHRVLARLPGSRPGAAEVALDELIAASSSNGSRTAAAQPCRRRGACPRPRRSDAHTADLRRALGRSSADRDAHPDRRAPSARAHNRRRLLRIASDPADHELPVARNRDAARPRGTARHARRCGVD